HGAVHAAFASIRGEGVIPVGAAIAQLLPVALGWVTAIVALCLVIRRLLTRFEGPTLAVTAGLLIGALFDAWPFRRLVPHHAGEALDGRAAASFQFRVEGYDPTTAEAFYAGFVVLGGFLLIAMLAKFSRRRGESALD